MKVFWYKDGPVSNFGDDLNRWLWSRISSGSFEDDGTLLLGIGTILSRNLIPQGKKKYVVFSSGVGYAPVPADFGGPAWDILAVRGPLTAAALKLPARKAIVDGAALLRLLPECKPLPMSERSGTAFMPHFASLEAGNWKQACEMAGLEFLDPLADSQQTVQRIRRAKVVIADAMHAAIVADALRVPWIPVSLSPQTNSFKWLDWTLSLGLSYNPTSLPSSTLVESIRSASLRFYGERHLLEDHAPTNALEHYRRMVQMKTSKYWGAYRWRAQRYGYELPRRIANSAVLHRLRERQDRQRTYRAAEALHGAAQLPLYLSEERIFMSKLDQLADLLPRLRSGGTAITEEAPTAVPLSRGGAARRHPELLGLSSVEPAHTLN